MPRTILLAEDNEDDVFFFQSTAKRLNWPHRILVAPNGREAIRQLEELAAGGAAGAPLSLVLLDLKMPFVGGMEVLEWAAPRPEFKAVPFCVLSSSEQETDIEGAYARGAAAFLVKPPGPEGLTALLQAIDAFWLRQNRLPAAPRAGAKPAAVTS